MRFQTKLESSECEAIEHCVDKLPFYRVETVLEREAKLVEAEIDSLRRLIGKFRLKSTRCAA